LREAVLFEAEAHLGSSSGVDKSWRRNASLAKVTILVKENSPFSLESVSELDRVDVLEEYLINHGSAITAYNDLRPFVEQLRDSEKKALLGKALENKIFGNPFSEPDNVSDPFLPVFNSSTVIFRITQIPNDLATFIT
jgi:N-terminal acetyltransferase B complex non-catalytic subunit